MGRDRFEIAVAVYPTLLQRVAEEIDQTETDTPTLTRRLFKNTAATAAFRATIAADMLLIALAKEPPNVQHTNVE